MQVIEKMVRPERFELPTFWFVGGICATRQHTRYNKNQRNQREKGIALGWRRLALYPVHGKLHGKFALFGFASTPISFLDLLLPSLPYHNRDQKRSADQKGPIEGFHEVSLYPPGRPVIVSAHNQAQYSDDRHGVARNSNRICVQNRLSASAQIPEVRLQAFEYTMLANSFRVGFRES